MNNLKEFAILAGVTTVRCDKGWGGTWAYKTIDNPNCTHCGFRSEAAAYKGWAKNTFGETASKALIKLLNRKFNIESVR